MDRLIFTAMSALKQLDSMKLKNSNALANASTVGFKETYTFATQTAQVAGAGFDSRFVPMNRSNDELVINSGPLITTATLISILKAKPYWECDLGKCSVYSEVSYGGAAGFLTTANGHTVWGKAVGQ